jgi:sugar/nucleoside kinase (ribokinase family)
MSLLVVGSIALDTLTTPAGKVEDTLGGSAVYFSLAARSFDRIRMVGVVGPDFPVTEKRFLEERNVDTEGLMIGQGPTFRWEGVYGEDFGDARTVRTELGVFASFSPKLPESFTDTPRVFLANIDPLLQLQVLEQVRNPEWIAMDTMNLWIDHQKDDVLKVMKRVDIVFVNALEARLLSGEKNLVAAGRSILDLGPKWVVIKLGGMGVMALGAERQFRLHAVPLDHIVDPTGAGDSFAAGMLGYLSGRGNGLDFGSIAHGLAHGAVTASFAVSGFGVEALRDLTREKIDSRLDFYLGTNQLERTVR